MSERAEIECAMREKRLDDETTISGHLFVTVEEHDHCHVEVSKCEHCEHVSVSWYRMGKPPAKVKA